MKKIKKFFIDSIWIINIIVFLFAVFGITIASCYYLPLAFPALNIVHEPESVYSMIDRTGMHGVIFFEGMLPVMIDDDVISVIDFSEPKNDKYSYWFLKSDGMLWDYLNNNEVPEAEGCRFKTVSKAGDICIGLQTNGELWFSQVPDSDTIYDGNDIISLSEAWGLREDGITINLLYYTPLYYHYEGDSKDIRSISAHSENTHEHIYYLLKNGDILKNDYASGINLPADADIIWFDRAANDNYYGVAKSGEVFRFSGASILKNEKIATWNMKKPYIFKDGENYIYLTNNPDGSIACSFLQNNSKYFFYAFDNNIIGLVKSDSYVLKLYKDGTADIGSKVYSDVIAISGYNNDYFILQKDGTLYCKSGYGGSEKIIDDSGIVSIFGRWGLDKFGEIKKLDESNFPPLSEFFENEDKYKYEYNAAEWGDIVCIGENKNHITGLRSDGTVVAIGSNEYGQCNVGSWKDVIWVWAGERFTLGLERDGSFLVVGENTNGIYGAKQWDGKNPAVCGNALFIP